MTTTLRIDPKKKTFSMSAIARLLHYISHNDAAGVQTEISNGADVNHAEPVRRPLSQSLAARGTDGSGGFGGSPRGRPRYTSRRSRMRAAQARATPSRSSSCCSMCAYFRRPFFPAHTLRLSERAGAGGQAGSTVDARDNQGNTPLQLARTVGGAKALLRAGADTACVNHVRMQTPRTRTVARVGKGTSSNLRLVRPGRGDGAGDTQRTTQRQ